jgi:hypothetical protein
VCHNPKKRRAIFGRQAGTQFRLYAVVFRNNSTYLSARSCNCPDGCDSHSHVSPFSPRKRKYRRNVNGRSKGLYSTTITISAWFGGNGRPSGGGHCTVSLSCDSNRTSFR